MENKVKLTKLANCAGCGAKVGAGTLSEVEMRVLESIAKDFGVKALRLEPGKSPALPRKLAGVETAGGNLTESSRPPTRSPTFTPWEAPRGSH